MFELLTALKGNVSDLFRFAKPPQNLGTGLVLPVIHRLQYLPVLPVLQSMNYRGYKVY